jgi:hypothetical protein
MEKTTSASFANVLSMSKSYWKSATTGVTPNAFSFSAFTGSLTGVEILKSAASGCCRSFSSTVPPMYPAHHGSSELIRDDHEWDAPVAPRSKMFWEGDMVGTMGNKSSTVNGLYDVTRIRESERCAP